LEIEAMIENASIMIFAAIIGLGFIAVLG